MIKIVYEDEGTTKVIRGDYQSEDDLFIHVQCEGKTIRIAKKSMVSVMDDVQRD